MLDVRIAETDLVQVVVDDRRQVLYVHLNGETILRLQGPPFGQGARTPITVTRE